MNDDQQPTLPGREDSDASVDETMMTLPPGTDAGGTIPSNDVTLPPRSASGEVRTIAEEPFGNQARSGQTDGSSERVKYFGEYELLQEIARGGMGAVYKARQTKLNRIVALKIILAGQLASPEEVQRFYIEAEAAANLEHPGIVPIREIGEHEGQHFFSMSFIEGESLDARVKKGPLLPREAAAITQQVAESIAYAHAQGVIHRDLKPANILIDAAGEPKVTDFSLAKKTVGDSGLTGTGQILGIPGYMPPEQASGETDNMGPAADIYSLGAILYAVLTGRPPFQSATVMDTLVAVLAQEPVAPRQLNPGLDQDLETICLKCLEKDAGHRYATADELVEELGRYLNGEPIQARPIGKVERAWRWCKRKPALAGLWALGAVLLLILGIGGPMVALQQAEIAQEQTENARNQAELRGQADDDRQKAETTAKPKTVRVAGIVLKWLRTDKEANYRRVEPMIRNAAAHGARIVCTSECFLDGYAIADLTIPLDKYRALGEPIPGGKYFERLRRLAKELKIYLIAGMMEAVGKHSYNTAVLIGPDGKLVGKYRKQKLNFEVERNTPGKVSSVFKTSHGRASLMICADRTDRGIVKRFCENGADFLICLSGGMFGPKRNDLIVQSRSRENRKYIIFVHPAEFLVTGPDGSIVKRTILGDRLLITRDQVGKKEDTNRVFYFDLPLKTDS